METILDEQAVQTLRDFFEQTALPDQAKLDPGATVFDLPLFIKTQFSILQSNSNLAARRPAFDRLLRLKTVLQGQ